MYTPLLNALAHTPAPYESTGLPFWDDEYISAQMLAAHLAPDGDGASRRHSFIDASAAWIARLATPGGRLLDLGCGPGLYATRFARMGLEVTGVDISRRSIAYATGEAHKSGLAIQYLCQSYLGPTLPGEQDMAVLIYCDYGVLPPEQRAAVLQNACNALKPGGWLVLDAFTPRNYQGFENAATAEYQQDGFWRKGPCVCIKRSLAYPLQSAYLEQYTIVTNEFCDTYNLWNTSFTPGQLTAELAAAGFAKTELYGDAAGAPLAPESPTLCAVCQKS